MKTVAIAVMLLATTAFGAVSLSVTPATQAPVGGQITLDFALNNGNQAAISAIALQGKPDAANLGKITTVSRTYLEPFASTAVLDKGLTDAAFTGKALETLNDLGGSGGSLSTTASGKFLTLVLNVSGLTYPATLTFSGSASDLDYNDYFFSSNASQQPNTGAVSVTITPEPASMLLLAVGGAFFARRRRA